MKTIFFGSNVIVILHKIIYNTYEEKMNGKIDYLYTSSTIFFELTIERVKIYRESLKNQKNFQWIFLV